MDAVVIRGMMDVGQRDGIEVGVHQSGQLVPQGMGPVARLGWGLGFDVVDGPDHVPHRNLRHGPVENITATRSPYAFDQSVLAQLGKNLFQVGNGDILQPGQVRQGHRTIGIDGEFQHGLGGIIGTG